MILTTDGQNRFTIQLKYNRKISNNNVYCMFHSVMSGHDLNRYIKVKVGYCLAIHEQTLTSVGRFTIQLNYNRKISNNNVYCLSHSVMI